MNETNQAQIDLWNGRVGEKWAALQVNVDAMLAAATAELKSRAGTVSGLRVLDIGCGSGVTCTLWLEGGADVTGVDVSEAMLAVARARTGGRARLFHADASDWKGDAPFDLAVSQFGVMFFADPDKAFASIAGNIRPGGRLLFVCWRAMDENSWVTTSMNAVRDLLPESPPEAANAPGPFGLADRDRLRNIIEGAGFTAVSISPVDIPVCIATEGGVEAAVRLVLQIGPTSRAIAEADPETKALAAERLKSALAPHEKNGAVKLGGAIWVVEAVRSV